MKNKLTLSIDTKHVAQLRKASARKSKSISAMIEEYADKLDKEESKGKTFKELFGDVFPVEIEEDRVYEDPRHAKHLRRSAAGQAVLKNKGRK